MRHQRGAAIAPFYYEHRYSIMFGTILAIFAVYPFVGESHWMAWVLEAAFTGTILATLLTFWRSKILIPALVLGLGSQVVAPVLSPTGIEGAVVAKVLRLGFLGFLLSLIALDVFRSKHVTMNTVFGAACVYLLMGLAWGQVFSVIEWIVPGSFNIPDAPANWTGTLLEHVDGQMLYYSLITLTTVGYGDITPVSAQAKILAGLEGLVGQLFVAIVLARLVALETSDRLRRRPDAD